MKKLLVLPVCSAVVLLAAAVTSSARNKEDIKLPGVAISELEMAESLGADCEYFKYPQNGQTCNQVELEPIYLTNCLGYPDTTECWYCTNNATQVGCFSGGGDNGCEVLSNQDCGDTYLGECLNGECDSAVITLHKCTSVIDAQYCTE